MALRFVASSNESIHPDKDIMEIESMLFLKGRMPDGNWLEGQ